MSVPVLKRVVYDDQVLYAFEGIGTIEDCTQCVFRLKDCTQVHSKNPELNCTVHPSFFWLDEWKAATYRLRGKL